MARTGIGVRVARWRDIAGLTQQQLADRVAAELGRPCSRQYIGMIEAEERPVTKRTLLLALTRALGVSITDLTGQPYPPAVRGDFAAYAAVPAIRAALDDLDEPGPLPTSEQLADHARKAMTARMHCDWDTLGEHLPPLLAGGRVLGLANSDPRAAEMLVRGAVTGALALKAAGWLDLAIRLAELADTVAWHIEDPACIAAASFARAQCALASGNRRRSLAIAGAAIDRLDLDDPAAFAWHTMLHLHAALTSASLHQADDAEAHLAAADAAARRVVGDPWLMEATPPNVATWAVGVALENGEPDRAPVLARRVNPQHLRWPQRRARLHLDTGRGHFLDGDHAAAVRALLAAERAAPGDLRQRPSAVEIVFHMVRAAPLRGGTDELRELATRVGVDPVAEPAA